MEKPEILICACHNVEHQLVINYDEEEKQAYVSVHLTKHSFFKRLKHGIKYIFGYKCRFGDFEEMILNETHADSLIDLGNKLK